MPFEPDHVLLGKFVDAHEYGDLTAAAEYWERLAVSNFDRVLAAVKAFRFMPSGTRIPEDEQRSAASEAYMRVIAMSAGFRKREPGRYYAALNTLVEHTCLDFGRKERRHQKRAAGSLDQRYEPDGDAGPYDAALAAYDSDLRRQSREALEEEASRQEAERLVAWGIAQIKNDNYREVLELTYLEKLPGEAIAQRLAIKIDNVYKRRERGLDQLERILREHHRS
jgi:RNA polymerase sigma factor (sigma-70 family)